MTEQVVTTLVSKMKFEADNRPLLSFEKNLDRIFSKVDSLTKLAQKKINLKVGLDSKSLHAQLRVARNTKIVLSNLDVSKEAVATTMAKLSEKLAGAKLRIDNVSISMKSIAAQKRLMRDLLDATQIELPVELRLRGAEKQLTLWKKTIADKHKLYLTADISKHKLYQNIKKSLDYVTTKTQAMRLEPMIQLKVDRNGLKKEIEDVLHQIERAAKIRIQLNGDISGGQQGGGGGDTNWRRHAVTGGVAGAAMHWGRGFVPGLGGAFAVSQMNQINQEYKGAQTALEAVSGQDYASNETFLKGLSKEQGRNFRDLAPQFTNILASSKEAIGSKGTQDMFRGIMKYGTMMNLDPEAMKGSFRAIGQMFSKDKIQAEEAQGQFAERMPAGMQLLAQAHGTTVAQLRADMQKGKLDPKKLIPELGKIMENLADSTGGYAKALQSTRVAQGRFNAAFEESVILFADSGMDRALGNFFRGSSDQMERSAGLIKALGKAFEWMMIPVNAVIRLVGDFSEFVLPKLAEYFGTSEAAVTGFGIATAVAMTPLGRLVLVISGIVTALDDFITYLKGGESEFGKWMDSLKPETAQAIKEMGYSIVELGKALGGLAQMSMEGLKNLWDWFTYFLPENSGASLANGIKAIADSITGLVNALTSLKNGDFGAIWESMKKGADNIGKGGVGALDLLLPGTPFTNMSEAGNRWMNENTPEAQRKREEEARAKRIQEFEKSRGSGADVPLAQTTVNLTVHGVQGAEDMVDRIRGVMDEQYAQVIKQTQRQRVV